MTTPHSSLLTPNYLITGGCGFLGTALIKHLTANNLANHIRVLDNLTVGTREDLATACSFTESPLSSLLTPNSSLTKDSSLTDVQLVVGDIRDPETCEACCHNIDVIIHLAANTGVPVSVAEPRLDMECNVNGTFNMLEGARAHKVKRFVFASSGAPAGEVEPPIHEELPPHPVSPYGASKLAGEGYCSAYFRTYGVETVALRFGNVYGPGSKHKSSVVAKFIRKALNGETLEIYGDGSQTRDFIYIDDLVYAVYKAATIEGIGGEVFQIASAKETTINEITDLLVTQLVENGIKGVEVKHQDERLGDVKRNFSDTSKAKKRLRWVPTTDLVAGLKETILSLRLTQK